MPTPLDALITPLTVDAVRLSIYSVLAQLGIDTTVWKPGAVVRTMIAATSIMLSGLSQLTAAIARSGFLETAEGTWLELLAKNVYGVTKIKATFATGTGVIANTSGGIYVLSPGELQVTNQRTGATYVNVDPLTIPAVSSGILAALIAQQAGSTSTALVSDPMIVSTPLPGVTLTLATSLVGLDDELDPALRLRCQEKLGALSPNGPPDAYGFVARSAVRPDGSPIGITRVRVSANGDGTIDLYVTNATGDLGVDDLVAVDLAIQTQAAPLSITVTTHAAVTVPLTVAAQVFLYRSGLDNDTVSSMIAAELTDFFSSQPIGGNIGAIHTAAIIAAIGRTSTQLPIFRVILNQPALDFVMSTNQVAVMSPDSTFTVTQIPSPSGV